MSTPAPEIEITTKGVVIKIYRDHLGYRAAWTIDGKPHGFLCDDLSRLVKLSIEHLP